MKLFMWDVYTSLAEALDNIGYDNSCPMIKYCFISMNGAKEKAADPIVKWIGNILINMEMNEDSIHASKNIASELVFNLYDHSPFIGCSAEVYAGRKGILTGTRQTHRFFIEEQISALAKQRSISSRKYTLEKFGGGGTANIATHGDGILILPEEKSIYVAKMY